jgi:hypothetical protein
MENQIEQIKLEERKISLVEIDKMKKHYQHIEKQITTYEKRIETYASACAAVPFPGQSDPARGGLRASGQGSLSADKSAGRGDVGRARRGSSQIVDRRPGQRQRGRQP